MQFLDMSENYSFPQLSNNNLILQLDDASVDFAVVVCGCWNVSFPGLWVGKGGQTACLLHSPDLLHLDFSIWGYVKDQVFSQRVNTMDVPKALITAAIANVTNDMLQSVWQWVDCRLYIHVCRATYGVHCVCVKNCFYLWIECCKQRTHICFRFAATGVWNPGIFLLFIHSSMDLQPFVGPWPLLQFHNLFYTDGRTSWTSDQPVPRPLPTQDNTNTE
jgi:hypothetical protein